MAVLTALAIGAAAAAGAGAYSSSRRARKDAEKEAKRQQTAAKEAAALESAQSETGANIEIGTDDPDSSASGGRTRRRTTRASGLPVGGVSASGVGGL